MLRLINYWANTYDRYEVLPVALVFVVGKFASTTFEKKFVRKANTPYILETQCKHWAKSANFVSAVSIQAYIQDSMDPFVAVAYFTTSQAHQHRHRKVKIKRQTRTFRLNFHFIFKTCTTEFKKCSII